MMNDARGEGGREGGRERFFSLKGGGGREKVPLSGGAFEMRRMCTTKGWE